MIGRIGKLMRVPLARTPGRRAPWSRLVPEICAGLVYVTGFTAVLLADGSRQPLMIGVLFAYIAAGLILLVVPAALAATSLAYERDRGTMDALVLTALDHSDISRGRFWHTVVPWLRFMAYLLPIYIGQAVAVSAINTRSVEGFFILSTAYVFAPKPAMIALVMDGARRSAEMPCWTWVLMCGRIAKDAVDMMAAVGMAYYISARLRRGVHALLISCVAIPVVMLTVFCAAEWGGFFLALLWRWLSWSGPRSAIPVIGAYLAAAIAVTIFEIWLASALVRRVARNFDRYAVGEIKGP